MALLEVEGLTVRYGGLTAVDSVDLKVEAGQLVGLIGPNGAGKTTFVDAITGLTPSSGTVRFDGARIDHLKPHLRTRKGLVRTFQSLELFDDLTVTENVRVAADACSPGGLPWVRTRDEREQTISRALHALDLEHLADKRPTALSHGQRKLVGVARSLGAQPKLLILDEPAGGLDVAESIDFGDRLRRIVETGIGGLLIDHDMGLIFRVCDYVFALEFGTVIAQGTPEHVRSDHRVITAYLGESAASIVEQELSSHPEGASS